MEAAPMRSELPASHRLPQEIILHIFHFAYDIHDIHESPNPPTCIYQLFAPGWCRGLQSHLDCQHHKFRKQPANPWKSGWNHICHALRTDYLTYIARKRAVLVYGKVLFFPGETGTRFGRFTNAYDAADALRFCLRPELRSTYLCFVDQEDCYKGHALMNMFRREIRMMVLGVPRRQRRGEWPYPSAERIGMHFENLRDEHFEHNAEIDAQFAATRGRPEVPWTEEYLCMVGKVVRDELAWPLKVDWRAFPRLETLCLDLHAYSTREVPDSIIVQGANRMKGMGLRKLIIGGLMSYKLYVKADHHQPPAVPGEDVNLEKVGVVGEDEFGESAEQLHPDGSHDAPGNEEEPKGPTGVAVPFVHERIIGSSDTEPPMSWYKAKWTEIFQGALRPGGSVEFIDFPIGRADVYSL